MDLFSLKRKRALVTGSSRGLGLAMAAGLGRAGATVILNGRDEARLGRAVRGLKAKRVKAYGYSFDVTRPEEVADAVSRVERELGPIGILVNNVGINLRAPVAEMEIEKWHEVMDANLHSVFYVSRAVGRRMVRRRRGKIINVASLLSEAARPTTASYAASKGAVKMLTKSLAVEWAQYNIQVNAIGPGYFDTELTRPLVENRRFDAWVKSRTPAGRWGRPEELAGAAVFLASRASDFITGQVLYVDGGWLANL